MRLVIPTEHLNNVRKAGCTLVSKTMNSEIEKKLSELRKSAEQQNELALHVALHMLHACYLNGTHKQFAKHCCEFSEVKVSLNGPKAEGFTDKPVRLQ